MKKTKRALLAALACMAVFAGAFGLAACDSSSTENGKDNIGNVDNSQNQGNENQGNGNQGSTHSHSWGEWSVATAPTSTAVGKATRTCGNSGCDAAATDKERELPVLTDTVYGTPATKTKADCATEGVLTYTYNNGGVNVSFDVNVGKNANVHDYTYTNAGPTGHNGVCSHSEEHTTSKPVAHDTDGENGGCVACGVVKLKVTEAETQPAGAKRYSFVVAETGFYEIWGAEKTLLPNITAGISGEVSLSRLGEGDALEAITDVTLDLYLTEGTYYIDDNGDNTISVVFMEAHEHTFNTDDWVYDTNGHWHATKAPCTHNRVVADYGTHSFGEWSEPNEEGVIERACVCGYKEYDSNDDNSTKIEGSDDWENPEPFDCTQTGNYTVTIGAEEDWDSFPPAFMPATQYFILTNNGTTAKQYTFKLLNGNTYMMFTPEDEDYSFISENGATYTVTLAVGESIAIDVSTNDEEVEEDYTAEAMFKVTVEDAA